MKFTDIDYMQRCFDLARLGAGSVAPNPMVGAVVVHNNRIIGEGFHQKYGEAHAEVNAINSVKDKSLLKESTIYVSLEPCAHFGKTPPCADLIVKSGIPRVVVACIDSFSAVAGKGIERMRRGGCEVEVGLLESQAKELNRRFFTFHEQRRPYIILKWAQTADGFIDIVRTAETPTGPFWITGQTEKHHVHKWRSREAAIMVATNTAEKDNPALDVRDWCGNSPTRIVIDKNLRLSTDLKLFDGSQTTLVFNSIRSLSQNNTHYIKVSFERGYAFALREILQQLYLRNLQSVLVEGGSLLHQSLIDENLWDEARVFTGFKTFGKGKRAASIRQSADKAITFDQSILHFYTRRENS